MAIVVIIGIIATIIVFYGIWQNEEHSNNHSNDNTGMSGRVWVISVIILFIVVNIFALKDCSKHSGSYHIEYRHSD